MIDFETLRNTDDEPTLSVEEKGLIDEGTRDLAVAAITGSYPPGANEYARNKVSDMEITLLSGAGKIIVNSREKRRIHPLQSADTSVTVLKGEPYFYSADPGVTLEVSMKSTPPWNEAQYDIITRD